LIFSDIGAWVPAGDGQVAGDLEVARRALQAPQDASPTGRHEGGAGCKGVRVAPCYEAPVVASTTSSPANVARLTDGGGVVVVA
jgi:hypothetical protein